MFKETLHAVPNRGTPPTIFLETLVAWARDADMLIFAPNQNPADIYASVKPVLGPWEGLEHRRAVMLEVMRVHAGFESSWHWNEGVDKTNKTSQQNIEGEETGIFQVSFNSTYLGNRAMSFYASKYDIETPAKFIRAMKTDHLLALDYYARLIRVSIRWAGPLARGEVHPFLRRQAVSEFMELLKQPLPDGAKVPGGLFPDAPRG